MPKHQSHQHHSSTRCRMPAAIARLDRLTLHLAATTALPSGGRLATVNSSHAACSSPSQRLEPALRVVEDAVSQRSIPGASVLVMQYGEPVVAKSFGTRDAGPGAGAPAFETDTICYIASLTKPFTAAAAMLLVERGLLSLEDPIAKHLPEFAQMQTEDGRASRPAALSPVALSQTELLSLA